ncbi:tyrosine-type recombinase/integrase [Clostridium chromiireducens]|jgi:Site-specific recombinase XerD|uniref:Tyrosine-type recombinase/integrase n=1 Tax=Clostridium chromiireducens TaxID=225345 RepID=A0A964RLA5_9CLOT|nr:tyrosine-type recombinase/integrase [Clostridium chromiireducens]MVX63736.1 tyrosine-type recombinase/integrase [Clostridium chromiireducens]
MGRNNINELNQLIDKIGIDKLTPASLELLLKNFSESNNNDITDNDSNTKDLEIDINNKKSKKVGIVTRALEEEEYNKIMELLNKGFYYENKNGRMSYFRPQHNVALALSLEATLGLRISDILKLKVKHFQKNTLEILEKKTNKLQYREINPEISEYIRDYALEHTLGLNDNLIYIKERWIQDRLNKVSKHLGLTNIGTHSFRKYFATYIYNKSNGDIDLVRSLLNHSSITITQVYLKTSQKKINEYSRSVNFLVKNNIEKDNQEDRK